MNHISVSKIFLHDRYFPEEVGRIFLLETSGTREEVLQLGIRSGIKLEIQILVATSAPLFQFLFTTAYMNKNLWLFLSMKFFQPIQLLFAFGIEGWFK